MQSQGAGPRACPDSAGGKGRGVLAALQEFLAHLPALVQARLQGLGGVEAGQLQAAAEADGGQGLFRAGAGLRRGEDLCHLGEVHVAGGALPRGGRLAGLEGEQDQGGVQGQGKVVPLVQQAAVVAAQLVQVHPEVAGGDAHQPVDAAGVVVAVLPGVHPGAGLPACIVGDQGEEAFPGVLPGVAGGLRGGHLARPAGGRLWRFLLLVVVFPAQAFFGFQVVLQGLQVLLPGELF